MEYRHRSLSLLVALVVCLSSRIALAEAEATNERAGQDLAHTLMCRLPTDISKSPIPGFLSIVIAEQPIRQVRHMPIARIAEINEFSYGVYIEFVNERMKNGGGFMTTAIFVPSEVLEPKAVIELVRSATKE